MLPEGAEDHDSGGKGFDARCSQRNKKMFRLDCRRDSAAERRGLTLIDPVNGEPSDAPKLLSPSRRYDGPVVHHGRADHGGRHRQRHHDRYS